MKPRVLLIDDNRHLRVTLADHLSHDGFDVTTAESGEEGLEMIDKSEPDLIILDINMPGMGGMGFLRRIMAEDGRPKYPVLVLTARSAMDAFFGSVPVDDFLAKPCPMSELLEKMRAILKKRGIRSQSEPQVATPGVKAKPVALIAEDDDEIREQIVRFFEHDGFDVSVAKTGPEVMEMAPVLQPGLVVMKQLLPQMNGNVIAPMIAGMPSLKGTPIILYDDTRKYEDPQIFAGRLPPSVTRYLASNHAHELLHLAHEVLKKSNA
jgi:DNA-binding response OmpR family regulator